MLLNEFKSWLLKNEYKTNTAQDYVGRIERLCRHEGFSLDILVKDIKTILPAYECGEKYMYGNRSHTSVKQALRRFNMFLIEGGR